MKRLYVIISFVLYTVSVWPALCGERFYFSNLTVKDGLSQMSVLCMHQDKYGYLWFGTRSGLNRYDGYRFETFYAETTDSIRMLNCNILCLAEDDSGHLWVGTRNGLNRLNLTDYSSKVFFNAPQDSLSLKNDYILSLCWDKKRLWIGTRSGLCYYDPQNDFFKRITLDGILPRNQVFAIEKDPVNDNILWLGLNRSGLIKFNTSDLSYEMYSHNIEDKHSLCGDNVRAICFDSSGGLWVGTRNNGVSYMPSGDNRFRHFNTDTGLTNNEVRCIVQSSDSMIYVGTYNGISGIDMATGKISRYDVGRTAQGDISHFSIFSMMFDHSGTFWIGTNAGGVNFYNPMANRFRYYSPTDSYMTLHGILGTMVEYEKAIYIATEGDGLLEFDIAKKSFRSYHLNDNNLLYIDRNVIKSLFVEGNKILCATNYGTIYSFDTRRKKFTLLYDVNSSNKQNEMMRDSKGALMIACTGSEGLVRIMPDGTITKRFQIKDKNDYGFPNMYSMMELEEGVFLFGTRNEGILRYDMNERKLTRYRKYPQINKIVRDDEGNIWLATMGGGLVGFDADSGTFLTSPNENLESGLNIYSVITVPSGELWMSTSNGIGRYDPATGKSRQFTLSDRIPLNEFSHRGGLLCSSGEICFSGDNGLIMFDPDLMNDNPFVPPIRLSELYVNNSRVKPGDGDRILSKIISLQDKIVLKYNQSNIAIEYVALNYISSRNNDYTYILEGFDKEWIRAGNRRTAYYTNLLPGKYRFKVSNSNNDGVWNTEEASIGITILPPFWKMPLAYLLYFLMIASSVWFAFHYVNERRKLQNTVLLEQMKAQMQQKFNEERNKLFTNFSHELRSPLTLIISPLEKILGVEDYPFRLRSHLLLMYNNSRRLLRIVNNLLDFTKKEHGRLHLEVSERDMEKFSNEMFLLFRELALVREIDFRYRGTGPVKMYFDRNLMEKVFFNLLSNAFKNTPNNGYVELRLTRMTDKTAFACGIKLPVQGTDFMLVEVEDSGIGVPEEEREEIFKPFYQVSQSEHTVSGTGLGLSLTKSIVEMHHGCVWVEKAPSGGALFRCIIPIDEERFAKEQFKEEDARIKILSDDDIEMPMRDNDAERAISTTRYTIMVVEDNADMRHYIVSSLENEYNVVAVSSGEQAFERAFVSPPDLVVSDLMMKGIDGLKLCRRLKEDKRTSHIPIIMVTAKASVRDIKTGFEAGVDDYVTKPFNADILLLRVRSLLLRSEHLKKLYSKDFSLSTLGIKMETKKDEKIMQRIYEIMAENLINPELNLYDHCMELGMSRANLYRRITAISSLSPSEFVRRFRLETAAKLLVETDISISEISVMVGFNSVAYFSSSFKSFYGIPPSKYQHRKS